MPDAKTLRPCPLPAGESLAPGWFALSPDQFEGDPARSHGRWFRLASGNAAVYRALQLSDALPGDGIALDWLAHHALEDGRAGTGTQGLPLRVRIRPARFYEYPSCLLRHPNPSTRLGGLVALLLGGCLLAAAVGAGLGLRDSLATPPRPSTAAPAPEPVLGDVPAFLHAVAGDWRAEGEALSIRIDRGILELVRQTQTEPGRVRLEQLAAAPVAYRAEQRALDIDTPAGLWRMALLPGERRARLVISYPDRREVIYE